MVHIILCKLLIKYTVNKWLSGGLHFIQTKGKTRNKIIDILREQVSNQDVNNSETFIAKTLSVYTNLLTSLSKQNNKNINLLKQSLLSNYQHTFFTENVYNSYIVKKNN